MHLRTRALCKTQLDRNTSVDLIYLGPIRVILKKGRYPTVDYFDYYQKEGPIVENDR